MFDTNNFKRSIKEWVKTNPRGTIEDLVDYCEDLIPVTQYQSHGWLIEQTVGWYEHVLSHRRSNRALDDSFEEEE